jgi:hypothetical protein
MSRETDLEFITELLDEFDLSPSQRIATLIECLEDDDEDD